MTILAVDDDDEDVEIFCDAIREIDPSIICLVARTGEEGLTILNSDIYLPDFIFLDINMPGIDGNVCLKEIRKDQRLNNIPVVMFSTYSSKKDQPVYEALGASFVLKQNSYSRLVAELKKVLGRT